MTPKISIIVATYNSGKTLRRCLDSIIPQLGEDGELLIIDGNSKDDTMDIVRSYGDKIAYSVSEPDKGVYDAWNKGVKAAKGQFVTFIGSDDMMLPTAFEHYNRFFAKNGYDYDIISGKLFFVDKEGKVLREVGEPWVWKKFVRSKMSFAHPGCLHNKRLFDRIGYFNLKYRICADSDFFQRIGPDASVGFIDEFLVRMSQGGISDGLGAIKESFYTRKYNHCIPLWLNYFNTIKKVIKYYGGKYKRMIFNK